MPKQKTSKPNNNLRNYGFPDMGETPAGIPVAKVLIEPMPCPNCGCQLLEINVPMTHPRLKGGEGMGVYLGCPACPFASPMMTRAQKIEKE